MVWNRRSVSSKHFSDSLCLLAVSVLTHTVVKFAGCAHNTALYHLNCLARPGSRALPLQAVNILLPTSMLIVAQGHRFQRVES